MTGWRTIRALLALNYGISLQYRAQGVLWMITGLAPLIMMMIWLQLAEGGPIGGYDATTFAQYFLFMFLARQSTPTWVIYLMDRGVKNGELTPYLLQPMHPVWHYATQHWGELLARLPIILPILAIGLTVADAWSWALVQHLPAFLLGLAMAWLINFMVHMTVGLIAFWSDNALGYDTVIYQLYIMLGGVVIPVELFPETMQRVLAWTPFPYVLDFPVRVMIGRIEGIEMLAGFAIQLFWIAAIGTLFAWGWRKSLRQYSAAGREGRMNRYFKLIALFIRATVQVQLEYRSGAVGRVIANLLSTATIILLLWAMFQQVERVGGWSFDQVLVLIGIVTTVDYVVEVWLYPSLSKITTYVQRGEFDVLLIKPVPSQFLVTFRYLQVLDIFGLAAGLAIIGIGMHRTDSIEPLNLALLALFLVASIVIIYSLYLALSTLAFWFTRIEEVASMIWLHSTAGSFPVAAYPPWARLLFTFVLPVAFVTNVPAQAATGRLSLEWGLGALAFSAFALCGATLLWNLAIRNYSSASS